MSGDTGRPSSREVADEAEDTRAHLASTLEQLRTNLRPENVVDEVVANARVGAANLADSLADVARQHPIPAALLAAGSALAMRVFSRRRAVDAAAPEPSVARPAPVVSRPTSLRNPAVFAPAPGRDAASNTMGDPMPNLPRLAPRAGEPRSKLSNLLEQQPLILGAIGLAVGAAIGAALPITETEENLLGPTAHRFRETAADAARHEVDGVRAAAGEAFDNVRQATRDNVRTVVDRAGTSLQTGNRDV